MNNLLHRPSVRLGLLVLAVIGIVAFSFWGAQYVAGDQSAQAVIEQFGILGIVMLGFIGGLNLFVPIPAATFTPIFIASGFSFVTIIGALVIGTTLADLVGYYIGRLGKHSVAKKYPYVYASIVRFEEQHCRLIMPGVFLYSALIPFPNEVLLIPLGLAGFQIRTLLLPVILGTIVNQTILALGFQSIFELVF